MCQIGYDIAFLVKQNNCTSLQKRDTPITQYIHVFLLHTYVRSKTSVKRTAFKAFVRTFTYFVKNKKVQ